MNMLISPPITSTFQQTLPQSANYWRSVQFIFVAMYDHSCIWLTIPLCVFLLRRWNSSAMRRWLKENFLTPGDGTPLHSIDAIEDLQRALASFSGSRYSLSCCILLYSILLYAALLCSTQFHSTVIHDSNVSVNNSIKFKTCFFPRCTCRVRYKHL